jgi:hypothetical protein
VPSPVLRFNPTAWAKLLFLRDVGDTEVGGFAITAADDLLLVENIAIIRQTCTGVSVAFDDEAVADFFDHQFDLGLKPQQFARIWVHSHPGDCPKPSYTDEATFSRVFGVTDWAVMFIIAEDGQCYARLRFNVGPGGEIAIPVAVDYSQPFVASDHEAWLAEYAANVQSADYLVLDRQPAKDHQALDAELLAAFGATGDLMPDWPEGFEDSTLFLTEPYL